MVRFRYLRLFGDPYVAVVVNDPTSLEPGLALAAAESGGRAAHLVVRNAWESTRAVVQRIGETIVRARTQHPAMRFTVLAETEQARAVYARLGIDAINCSNNAFADERIFYPSLSAPKAYDAVYTARLNPMKRIELAALAPSLAIITGTYEVEPPIARQIIAGLPGLAYCNYDVGAGEVRPLSPQGVNAVLGRAACGLALSRIEGTMIAAAEYLLAGLPVVTTPARGGREVFFDSRYVQTAAAEPQAVAQAIARFKADPVDPLLVRTHTLELMLEHRRRLLTRLSQVVERDLFQLAGPSLWLPQYRHGLKTVVTLDEEL